MAASDRLAARVKLSCLNAKTARVVPGRIGFPQNSSVCMITKITWRLQRIAYTLRVIAARARHKVRRD